MDREARIRTKASFSLTAIHASVPSGVIEDNNEGRLKERGEGREERENKRR